MNVYIVSHPQDEPSYNRKRPMSRMNLGWNTFNRHKRKFIKWELSEWLDSA